MKKHSRRLIACVLAMAMVMSSVPVAFAENDNSWDDGEHSATMKNMNYSQSFDVNIVSAGESDSDSGTEYSSSLIWEIVDEEVIITGCDTTVEGHLEIPSSIDGKPVTKIGAKAFENCVGITGISIPATVEIIESDAFSGCSNLIKANYASIASLLNISFVNQRSNPLCGNYFPNSNAQLCIDGDAITTIAIPDGTTEIGAYTFAGARNLTSITIPETVSKVGEYAFYYCSAMMNVYADSLASWLEIEFIGDYSAPFSGKWSGDGLLYFNGEQAEELVIPDGTTTISPNAFYGCTNFDSLILPSSVKKIGKNAFANCNIDDVYVDNLNSWLAIEFGNSYSNPINYNLFVGGELLTEFVPDEDVSEIPAAAFAGCTSLETVTIPSTVKVIGTDAFSGCTNIEKINIDSVEDWVGKTFESTASNPLYSSTGSHLYVDGEEITDIVIPEGVECIEANAFAAYDAMTSVNFPSTLEFVGTDAFLECGALTSVHIEDFREWFDISFENLSSNPFYSRSPVLYENGVEVTNIEIPNDVTELKSYSLAGFYQLNNLVIPESVKHICEGAFYSCLALKSVTLPDDITLDPSAFYFSTKLVAREGNSYVKNYAHDRGLTFETLTYTVNSISFTPEKNEYAFEEDCDLVGQNLIVNCEDTYGTFIKKVSVEDSMISGFDTSTPGEKTVTIQHDGFSTSFTIVVEEKEPIDISDTDAEFALEIKTYVYDGTAKEPRVIVTGLSGEYTMTCKYKRNVNVGTAYVDVTFSGDYVGEMGFEFTILSADISQLENKVLLSETVYDYDETEKKPTVTIDGLEEGTDFTVEYDQNREIGTALVLIFGCNNYSGRIEKTFKIEHMNHTWQSDYTIDEKPTCTTPGSKFMYCKYCDAKSDTVSVPADGLSHTWGDVYIIDKEATCTSPGSQSIHCIECSATTDVMVIPVSSHKEKTIPGKAATCTETGLTEGKQCEVCKTVTVKQETIPAKGHTEKAITGKAATCIETGLTDGKQCEVCKTVTVKQEPIPAKGHTDTSTTTKATTSKNGKVVTKCATCGETLSSNTIYKAATVKLKTATYTYNGKTKNPVVTVKDSKGNTISAENYTITKAKGRKNVGKYTYKITFKNQYKGTKKLTFTINPKATSVKSLTKSKKAFTVKWGKVSKQVTGYEVMYSTSKNFKKGKLTKTKVIKKAKTTSLKVTKLKAKTKYYVKVRTYKTVNGVRYYSSWSKVKSVKTR